MVMIMIMVVVVVVMMMVAVMMVMRIMIMMMMTMAMMMVVVVVVVVVMMMIMMMMVVVMMMMIMMMIMMVVVVMMMMVVVVVMVMVMMMVSMMVMVVVMAVLVVVMVMMMVSMMVMVVVMVVVVVVVVMMLVRRGKRNEDLPFFLSSGRDHDGRHTSRHVPSLGEVHIWFQFARKGFPGAEWNQRPEWNSHRRHIHQRPDKDAMLPLLADGDESATCGVQTQMESICGSVITMGTFHSTKKRLEISNILRVEWNGSSKQKICGG